MEHPRRRAGNRRSDCAARIAAACRQRAPSAASASKFGDSFYPRRRTGVFKGRQAGKAWPGRRPCWRHPSVLHGLKNVGDGTGMYSVVAIGRPRLRVDVSRNAPSVGAETSGVKRRLGTAAILASVPSPAERLQLRSLGRGPIVPPPGNPWATLP